MTSDPNDLKKALLIKTFSAYARKHLDEMSNQIIASIIDNLPEYAVSIQTQIPQLWPWLDRRSKAPINEQDAIDKTFFDSLEKEPNAYIWIADLWELYLSRHQHDKVLFDLALNKVYEGIPDDEIRRTIEALQP